MKNTLVLPLLTALFSSTALAGSAQLDAKSVQPMTVTKPGIQINFKASSDYVGRSDFRFNPAGDQDAFHAYVEAGVSIPLSESVYYTINGFYDRFDFGTSLAPVPTTLYKIGTDIALEYRAEGEAAIALIASPGIYSSEIRRDGFNIPITLFGSYRLTPNVVFVAGARYNEWSEYPILPSVGVIWRLGEHWKIKAITSAPKVEYSPNPDLSFSLGGELAGGTYQTAQNEQNHPAKHLDYYDLRAGVGVTYKGWKPLHLNLTAGWSFQRNFRYDDIDVEFKTAGAPYVAVSAKAVF